MKKRPMPLRNTSSGNLTGNHENFETAQSIGAHRFGMCVI